MTDRGDHLPLSCALHTAGLTKGNVAKGNVAKEYNHWFLV